MGNGNENTVNVMQPVKGFNWTVLIQLATMLFLAGIAYASFETKTHAAETAEQLRVFNAQTYMPRELSLEKWTNNDKKHDDIQRTLDAILIELRRDNAKAQKGK
jgi:hypothetical protein